MFGRLLTVEEVAARLRMTPGGLYQLQYRGVAPDSIRVGKRRLFPEESVEAWLEQRFERHAK